MLNYGIYGKGYFSPNLGQSLPCNSQSKSEKYSTLIMLYLHYHLLKAKIYWYQRKLCTNHPSSWSLPQILLVVKQHHNGAIKTTRMFYILCFARHTFYFLSWRNLSVFAFIIDSNCISTLKQDTYSNDQSSW